MSKEYPFYPELSEEGKKEADEWLKKFVTKMAKVAEETIHAAYCSCLPHIESDSWSNFRNEIMDGFKDYKNNKVKAEFDFKAIRDQILKENREQIIKDMDQDLLEENETLKERIEHLLKNRL